MKTGRPMSRDETVYLVDDDDAVRQSLAFLLMTSGYAVRSYASASSFLAELESVRSGCVVTDIRMPGLDGLGLQRILGERGCGLPVIVMTGHGDVPLAVEAMKGGAVDFLEKPFGDEVLLAAVQSAMERSIVAGKRQLEMLAVKQKLAKLSERERQVLDGLIAGHPNKTIAYDLKISARTVEVYRANVMTKMDATSLAALLQMVLSAD
jgi:two-component system response regulator FixJ